MTFIMVSCYNCSILLLVTVAHLSVPDLWIKLYHRYVHTGKNTVCVEFSAVQGSKLQASTEGLGMSLPWIRGGSCILLELQTEAPWKNQGLEHKEKRGHQDFSDQWLQRVLTYFPVLSSSPPLAGFSSFSDTYVCSMVDFQKVERSKKTFKRSKEKDMVTLTQYKNKFSKNKSFPVKKVILCEIIVIF